MHSISPVALFGPDAPGRRCPLIGEEQKFAARCQSDATRCRHLVTNRAHRSYFSRTADLRHAGAVTVTTGPNFKVFNVYRAKEPVH
jgi:hypothetical protein